MLKSVQNMEIDLKISRSLSKGIHLLNDNDYDLVLLDYFLPDSRGPHSIRSIRVQFPTVPIVVLTGLDDYQAAIRSIKSGADDYLIKGKFNLETLQRTISHAIEHHHHRVELENENQALKDLMSLDPDDLESPEELNHIW